MFETLLAEVLECTNAELHERIRANETVRRRLDAEQAALITVARHRQVHADDGHRSINAYLRATLNCSPGEASRLRNVAGAVDHVDGVGEAWLTGQIGSSQVAAFAKLWGNQRVRAYLPGAASLLVDQAEQLPYPDFVSCVDRFVHHADLDGAHDGRDDAVEHRSANVVDVGGMVDITAHGGTGVQSAELIAIFRRFCEAEFRRDLDRRRAEHGADADQHALARTARQRRFDALHRIFQTAATADGIGSVADPLVNIIIDSTTWSELLAESGLAPDGACGVDPALIATLVSGEIPLSDRRCETSTGIQVHPHDVLRAALTGHVRRVVVDSAGVVIDLGRRQRLFTGPARDAAKLLIRHCEHPGCDLPVEWCDVDHATEWADGGPTDQHNAGPECRRHNLAKTRQRWRKQRAVNGRNYTIRPDGTVILPVGTRRPTFPTESDDDSDDHTPAEVTQLAQLARARVADLTA
ncbi:MAG: DUF222 domain-containing protein [Ilumatobacteraceae bacterium]